MRDKLSLKELKLGMTVSKDQLSDIHGVYMLIMHDSPGDKIGKLVWFGTETDDTYAKLLTSGRPVCPILNIDDDCDCDYDEHGNIYGSTHYNEYYSVKNVLHY